MSKGKKDKNRVFVVNLKHDGIFSPYPFSYIHGDEKQLTDFDFEGMSYDNLRELVRKLVHCPTGYECKWVVDLYVEHHGNNGNFRGFINEPIPVNEDLHIEDPDSSSLEPTHQIHRGIAYPKHDSLQPWNEMQPILGMRDVSTGRCAGYFSKKVEAKKQLFTESHDDANKGTRKEGEGSSRNSDVSPKWTKSKIVSSRKSRLPQCGLRLWASWMSTENSFQIKSLREEHKGELLIAIGRDANNQMYPIAWAVVKVENFKNWSWFISLLAEDLELGHDTCITIISYSHKGLLDVVSDWLPNVEHREYIRHVFANFKNKFSGVQLQRLFWKAAGTTVESIFYNNMDQIKSITPKAYTYLAERNPNSWSRAFFDLNSKCASFENGIAETYLFLNKVPNEGVDHWYSQDRGGCRGSREGKGHATSGMGEASVGRGQASGALGEATGALGRASGALGEASGGRGQSNAARFQANTERGESSGGRGRARGRGGRTGMARGRGGRGRGRGGRGRGRGVTTIRVDEEEEIRKNMKHEYMEKILTEEEEKRIAGEKVIQEEFDEEAARLTLEEETRYEKENQEK
nr:hypothetical protein CTI12_AA091940 [Tanacetum cinerariifolium]GEX17592.1 hypothetical protein CTI12_AA091940 [Tanacetum cinerariifolium]GEX18889.1 hypothetical protein CTI12_AA091940 [Tanacetum cinerariifolium]